LADAAILNAVQTFCVLRERGNQDEAKPVVEKLRADAEGSPLWPALIALLNSETELPARARADFEALAATGFDSIPRDGSWAITIAILAELSAQLEDASRATALHQLLEPLAGRNIVGDGICLGPADRYLGMLAATRGDIDGAVSCYETVIGPGEASDQPIWRAYALLDLARVLIDRHGPGDQSRAAELLDEALIAAKSLDLVRLRDGCLALLSQKPNEGPLADGLTPAELRVLRLLASGATNRAIGERLFLSPHTVANHVRNILAKTGSANRTEAANYARRYSSIVDGNVP
jgi:DNA-binding CsgD family transcriptional regulator